MSYKNILYIVLLFICIADGYGQDTTPPVVVIPPMSDTTSCDAVNPIEDFVQWYISGAGAVATDNSGTAIWVANISLQSALTIFNNSADTLCGNTKKIRLSWKAFDPAGNETPAYPATFSVIDFVSPVVTNPFSASIECTSTSQDSLIRWIKNAGGAKAGDFCSPIVTWVKYNYVTSNGSSGTDSIQNGPYPIIPPNPCNWFVNASFIVRDECGLESVSGIRKFELKDIKPPILSITPPDVTVQCNAIPVKPNVVAVDACSGNTNVIFTETKTQNPDTTKCDHYIYTITRKWMAKDLCNNTVEHIQKILAIDDKGPSLSGPPVRLIECSFKDNIDSTLTIKKDACSAITLSFTDSLISGNGCSTFLKRKYTAKDVCFNTTNFNHILHVVDRSAPIINTQAKNQGIACTGNGDINQVFQAWLNNRGQSAAFDGCNNQLNSFFAVPGSYNLKDTLTFPGTSPGLLDSANCGLQPMGFSRAEKVDFVYYDNCGNASVTSAFFGITDNIPPTIDNCANAITKDVETADCSAKVSINISSATDDCSPSASPLVRFATSLIKSDVPGDNEILVNPFNLKFGPYNPNTFEINGNVVLNIDLIKVDADDTSEYFRIIDEQGLFVGKTEKTNGQCQDGNTKITIPKEKIQTWLADGFIEFVFIPNQASIPVLSINDVCPVVSRANASLIFPIKENNIIRTFYTESNGSDTTEITGQNVIERKYSTGVHDVKIIYEDCAQNKSSCDIKITVNDKQVPNLTCPKDTAVNLGNNVCELDLVLPLNFNVIDNCEFPTLYDQISPSSSETQKITFKYLESANTHIANNKVIVFENVPLIKYADTDAEIILNVTGDFNNSKEYFFLVGENGYSIGQNDTKSGTGCVSASKKFTIPKNIFNEWAKDGRIEITAIANNEGDEEGMGINPCQPLSPNQTIDNESSLSLQLITRQPQINLKLDNNNPFLIPGDSTKISLNLKSGKHIVLFTTKDKAGNTGSCTTNIEVKDITPPIAICKNFVAKIHPSGLIDFIVHPDSINNKSSDNCGIDSMGVENNRFTCADVGTEKTVALFVIDKYKNISKCETKIKIESTTLQPTFTTGLCDGDTLELFANVPLPVDNGLLKYEWYKDNQLVSILPDPIFPGTSSSFNGLYKVVVKGFGNCTAEGLMTINIKPLTTPSIESLKDGYCDNEEVILTTDVFSGNVKYEWYEGFPPNGTLLGITNNPEFSISAVIGVHNYYIIGRSPECVSTPSLTQRVFVYKKPEAKLLSFFQNICEGSDLVIGTTSTGQDYTYSWTGPNEFKSNAQNPPVIKNITSEKQGKYQLIINVKECVSDTASTNVVVIPKPGLPVINGESIYCEKSTLSLVVNNIPAQEKYTWYKDGIRYVVTQDNSLEIINVPQSASGKWQVQVESNGCKSDTSDIKIIEIDNLSLVGASNNGPVCEGDSIFLESTIVPNALYEWKGPGGFTGKGQNIKTLAKTGEYFVTITTTTGCNNTASTLVEVNQLPIITALSNNSKACMDGKTDVVFFPSVIPQGNFQYQWTGPDNFKSELQNPKISNANLVNNGNYILTVFNKNCPSKPDTSFMNISLTPEKAIFTGPSIICEGDTLSMISTSIADTFYWNTPKGIVKTTSNKLQLPSIKKSDQGNYYLIIGKGRCQSSDFNVVFVEVNEKPLAPAILGEEVVCFGSNLELNTNNNNFTDAIWTLPNGTTFKGQKLSIQNANSSNSGNYSVIGFINTCKSDASNNFILKVKDEILAPVLTNNKIELCGNESIPFEVCLQAQAVGTTYVWSDKDGNLIENTAQPCVTLMSNNFPLGTTFINVKTVRDGCESLTKSIQQISKTSAPSIKAAANIDEIAVCSPQDLIQLSSLEKEPLVDVKWKSLTSGLQIDNTEADKTNVQNFKKGINLILLSYSKDGCNDFTFDTVKVYLYDKPKAENDIIDINYNENKEFNIFTNDSLPSFYELKIGNISNGNLNGANDGLFTYEPATGFAGLIDIPYTVCVKGCNNLCDEAIITLQVGNKIDCVVPSIFTPNEDGINDELIIPCLNVSPLNNNEIIIFNQWGDQVYQSRPYNNDWKGTYGDDPLPVGTYYYVFNPGNGKNKLNGFIIIQR